MADIENPGNYLIEIRPLGNSVKVSAMDPETLTEVSIVGSPRLSEHELARAAVAKLEFVLARSEPQPQSYRKGKSGIIV